MVDVAGVADIQLAGDSLGAQHGAHEGGIIKADALARVHGLVHIRIIGGGDGGGLIVVILRIADHKVVDVGGDIQIIGAARRQLIALLDGPGVFREIHELIGIQEWHEFVVQSHVDDVGQDVAVHVSFQLFINVNEIGTVPGGQRHGRVRILFADKIKIGHAVGPGDLDVDLRGAAVVGRHDVALRRVGDVHGDLVAADGLFSVRGRQENGGAEGGDTVGRQGSRSAGGRPGGWNLPAVRAFSAAAQAQDT